MLQNTGKPSKNAAKDTENAEHADDQREKTRQKTEKSGSVALSGVALGDMDSIFPHGEAAPPAWKIPEMTKTYKIPISGLEAQQRYFSYRAILVAIVSQNFRVLVFMGVSHKYRAIRCKMGYRTDMPV